MSFEKIFHLWGRDQCLGQTYFTHNLLWDSLPLKMMAKMGLKLIMTSSKSKLRKSEAPKNLWKQPQKLQRQWSKRRGEQRLKSRRQSLKKNSSHLRRKWRKSKRLRWNQCILWNSIAPSCHMPNFLWLRISISKIFWGATRRTNLKLIGLLEFISRKTVIPMLRTQSVLKLKL